MSDIGTEPVITTKRIKVTLPPPHSEGQREAIEYPGSMVIFGGGRWGKSEAGVRRINRAMICDPGLYWWVGLSWQSASLKKAWRMLRNVWGRALREAGLDPRRHINLSSHEIELPNGSLLMLRSAENPESIAGDGPKGVVGDEFPYWREEVWTRFLQPALIDHQAWALLIGRPYGRNWATKVWDDAATRDGWLQRHYTIYDNPDLDRDLIEDIRSRTLESVWRQEYLAEAIDGAGAVFRHVDDVAILDPVQPVAGHSYVMGVDLARTVDYTVLSTLDASSDVPCQVALDRFHRLDWTLQIDRIVQAVERWRPAIVAVDRTGIGDMPFQELARIIGDKLGDTTVIGIRYDRTKKLSQVQALAKAFEAGGLRLLKDATQRAELLSFEAKQSITGAISYNAPDGMHDDTVTALMLAWTYVDPERTAMGRLMA